MKMVATTISHQPIRPRSSAVSTPMATAPTTGPRIRPRPPTAVQITRSADSTNPHTSGVTSPCWGAYNAPATPARMPLAPKAMALRCAVSWPKNPTRRSFWASARQRTPSGDSTSHHTAPTAAASATAAT